MYLEVKPLMRHNYVNSPTELEGFRLANLISLVAHDITCNCIHTDMNESSAKKFAQSIIQLFSSPFVTSIMLQRTLMSHQMIIFKFEDWLSRLKYKLAIKSIMFYVHHIQFVEA